MRFDIALTNVLMTLLYILPGYLLSKRRKEAAEHLPTVSAILIYICTPALIFHTFASQDFSLATLLDMGTFFVVTLVLQFVVMMGLYLLLRKKYADARYRLLTISGVLGNVGFFGLPVVTALLPDHPEVASYCCSYMVSMNIFVFTMSIFCLTGDKKHMSVRNALLNPSNYALYVGLLSFVLHGSEWIPPVLMSGIHTVGSMTTPLCMLILGIRLGQMKFGELFSKPFVYLICAFKLIVFPLVCYSIVRLIGLNTVFCQTILVLASVPCASIVLSIAEMYHAEQELAANCVLVSTLLCFMTIPVMTLLA